jgi:peroxiredoxin
MVSVRELGQVTVLDPEGRDVQLGSLWRERTAVLCWLRHFGCLFCKEQATKLHAVAPAFAEAGAGLTFIGNGTPEHARWFIEDFGIIVPVLTDPGRNSYRLLGARSGFLTSIDPRSVLATLRAMKAGHFQGRTRGTRYQQGGIAVITSDGRAPYVFRSRFAGDHPDPLEVVEAVRGVGRGAETTRRA